MTKFSHPPWIMTLPSCLCLFCFVNTVRSIIYFPFLNLESNPTDVECRRVVRKCYEKEWTQHKDDILSDFWPCLMKYKTFGIIIYLNFLVHSCLGINLMNFKIEMLTSSCEVHYYYQISWLSICLALGMPMVVVWDEDVESKLWPVLT